MTLKEQFKKSFSYTWYLYVLAIVLPCIAFPFSYSFMHRPQEYQKLSLFVPANVKNNDLSLDIENTFKNDGVKNVEIVSSDPNESKYNFLQKLNVVGINKCDVLILPFNILEQVNVQISMLKLDGNIKNKCSITYANFYSENNEDYGVELPKSSPLYEFDCINENTKYYAFIGIKSWNIGEYSTSTPNTSNGFGLMRYVLGL